MIGAVEGADTGAVLDASLIVVLFCVVDVTHPARSTVANNIAIVIVAKNSRFRFLPPVK